MDKGARFYRCDFQVHSPRDLAWKGAHYTKPEDRKAYAAEFIADCRKKGLDAVAITDHHDLCFFKYFRDAAASEKKEDGSDVPTEDKIVVFPGLELTLNTAGSSAWCAKTADVARDRSPLNRGGNRDR